MHHVWIIWFLTASAIGQESGDRAPHPVTRKSLWSSFPADTQKMVYRWDTDDPRSEEQRRRAVRLHV